MIVDQHKRHIPQLIIQPRVLLDHREVGAIIFAILSMGIGHDDALGNGQEEVLGAMLQIHFRYISQPRIRHRRLGRRIADQCTQSAVLLFGA